MLIAQVSDLHLRADPQHPNHARFVRVLAHLESLDPAPGRLVLSGDLSDDGSEQSYLLLRQALGRWPHPVHFALGNHDDRKNFLKVLGDRHAEAGFVQARTDLGGLHLIVLDSSEEGRAGGAFCEVRAQWLRRQVEQAGPAPVLVFMHHPPCDIGISWIDPGPNAAWTARLNAALAGADVAGICTGHVHMGGVFSWHGRQVLTCPSSSSDLSLIFAPMSSREPDHRPLVEQGEPAFALHRWTGSALASYHGRCPQRVLAQWDAANNGWVTGMLREAGL